LVEFNIIAQIAYSISMWAKQTEKNLTTTTATVTARP